MKFYVKDLLWDPELQRSVIGLLVEKLGGTVELTEAELSSAGNKHLYVELDPNVRTVNFSVIHGEASTH